MPIPKPNAEESRDDFVERCMGDSTMTSEYDNADQRTAVCNNAYDKDSKENDEKHIRSVTATDETFIVEFEREGYSEESKDKDLNNKTEHFETNCELKANGNDNGTFVGYGSIFGNKDLGNDVVEKGAFHKSLTKSGAKGVKMLWQHKTDAPIGIFEEIREDGKGLRVKGKLALGTQNGKEAYELMKMGAIDGMSVGYKADPAKQVYDEKNKRRLLKEVDLMEISLVTFPMNTRARIHAVKGEEVNIRDLERGLRDAFKFSRSDAKVAAKAVHVAFEQRDADSNSDIELLDAIRQTTTFLTKLTKGETNE